MKGRICIIGTMPINLRVVGRQAGEFFEDDFGCLGPDKSLGLTVVVADLAADGLLQIGNRFEHPPTNFPPGDDGKDALDSVEPRGRCRREVEDPAWVIGQPLPDLRMLVGAVVVEDGVDHLPGRDGPLDRVEELDEFLMPVLLHTPPQHRTVQDVEGGKQGGRTVALVVVGDGGAFAGFQRQTGLRAVESLIWLFLSIDSTTA